jgi:hypothetical protein
MRGFMRLARVIDSVKLSNAEMRLLKLAVCLLDDEEISHRATAPAIAMAMLTVIADEYRHTSATRRGWQ